MNEQYRIDNAYDTIYKWNTDAEAYVFFCKMNGRKPEQAIEQTEEGLSAKEWER